VNEDRLASKIKKLLEIADPDRGATEQERETALRQAHKLMRKASLDIADLDDAAYSGEMGELAKFVMERPGPSWTNWPCTLFGACMRLNYIFAVYGDHELIAFGRRGQYQPARALYESMRQNIHLAIKDRWPGTFDLHNASVQKFYDGFGVGASEMIYARVLDMIETEAKESTGSAGLVVRRGEADYDEAVQRGQAEYLLGGNRHKIDQGSAAFQSGMEFGGSVDISGGNSRRSQPKQIG